MPTAEQLAEVLRPLIAEPERAAIFCDIDGTLAPIVPRAEDARVPTRVSRLLGELARRYRLVACVSGRSAAEARRLVGVGGIAYAGSHGAELLEPNASAPRLMREVERGAGRVRAFVAARDEPDLRRLRVRIEDKGPIMAFHWRSAPDEATAHARVAEIAREAEADGLATHWGRKVLEIRPPATFHKGIPVRDLVRRFGIRSALFGGDDRTDLDAFDALDELERDGVLRAAVRVGIASEEGPDEIAQRADLVVEGTQGYVRVLEALVPG